MDLLQLMTILLLAVINVDAVKPPGYTEPQKELDSDPPRYEYGYKVDTDKGAAEQGKQEERDGIYASGRYYVQDKDSKQDVRYFADDWGFHPAVEYSNAGPHSNSRARFALGFEAVQQLKNKENNQPQLQGLPETGNLNKRGPQILPRRTDSVSQEHQPQNAEHLSAYIQSGNQESQSSDDNQQLSKLPTNSLSPQQTVAQSQQQQLRTTSELKDTEVQNSAYRHGQFDQTFQITRDSTENLEYAQQTEPANSAFEHQKILVFPNHHQQAISSQDQLTHLQEDIYAHQRVNEVIESENQDQHNFEEFGMKLHPRKNNPDSKLIETTQHLVSGQDVLDINSAITKQSETSEDSSTIQYSTGSAKSIQEISKVTHVLSTPCTPIQNSFEEQPIIVADYDEPKVQFSTTTIRAEEQSEFFVTAAKSSETISTTHESLSPSTIVVTPRPISTQFLAPITAGIRLQNIEHHDQHEDSQQELSRPELSQQQFSQQQLSQGGVRIQESIPYYLGKYEYADALGEHININDSAANQVENRAKEDLELGKTLMLFPELPRAEPLVQRPFNDIDNHLTTQQLPNSDIKDKFQEAQRHIENSAHQIDHSFQIAQIAEGNQIQDIHGNQQQEIHRHRQQEGNGHQQRVENGDQKQEVHENQQQVNDGQQQQKVDGHQQQESNGHQQYEINGNQQVDVHRFNEQHQRFNTDTFQVTQSHPVRMPYEPPYPVLKQVSVPVTMQRVIEKPVHITQYVEKPVPVPQPYPVQKVVEKPVHIPVQITRYIDRPYPVEVRVPYPQPYPVEKIVHSIIRQPYPVEVKIPYPVERIVEKKVHVPHYIDKPVTVEKIVEKPVTRYVDRPYPVERIVEKPVPHYVDRPYPVEVKVPVPQPFYVKVEVPRPHPIGVIQSYQRGLYQHMHEQNAQQSQQQAFFSNPYAYAPQINQYLPPRKEIFINDNGYLPPKQFNNGYLPPQTTDCDHHREGNSNEHVGLMPPRIGNEKTYSRRFRSARQFDDNSVRMEYGFMPPMVPSLEIDDQGNPVEKTDK